MRTIEQLRKDFALYTEEIRRCEEAGCDLALLHLLLALPDVCACLESDPERKVGNRYTAWCNAYLTETPTIRGNDRYQMRNALLHSGSTTAQNRPSSHRTLYTHFSYVDRGSFEVTVHGTTDGNGKVLNLHLKEMVAEMERALEKWFHALQGDPAKMDRVEENIGRLARVQPKQIRVSESNGNQVERRGRTVSSTGDALP